MSRMQKLTAALCLCLLLQGCGRPATIERITYDTYGFLNEGTYRSKDVCYEVSVGNIVWSIILFETVVAPIYFLGFSLFNSVRLKVDAGDDCSLYYRRTS